jgi:hypothetical protein
MRGSNIAAAQHLENDATRLPHVSFARPNLLKREAAAKVTPGMNPRWDSSS